MQQQHFYYLTMKQLANMQRYGWLGKMNLCHGLTNGKVEWYCASEFLPNRYIYIVCFNYWVVADKLKRQWKFILVLETNCISILSPNHTLQLTNLKQNTCEGVTGSGDSVQWLLYLQDHGCHCKNTIITSRFVANCMCSPFLYCHVWFTFHNNYLSHYLDLQWKPTTLSPEPI